MLNLNLPYVGKATGPAVQITKGVATLFVSHVVLRQFDQQLASNSTNWMREGKVHAQNWGGGLIVGSANI